MTLTQVFDCLCGQRVNRIDFTDGSFVVCPQPALVHYYDSDALADMWIEASEEGLLLHFNAKLHGGMRGETQPLSNIARVA